MVSKRDLLAEVWQLAWGGSDRTVDVHLSWLRRKLGETRPRRATCTACAASACDWWRRPRHRRSRLDEAGASCCCRRRSPSWSCWRSRFRWRSSSATPSTRRATDALQEQANRVANYLRGTASAPRSTRSPATSGRSRTSRASVCVLPDLTTSAARRRVRRAASPGRLRRRGRSRRTAIPPQPQAVDWHGGKLVTLPVLPDPTSPAARQGADLVRVYASMPSSARTRRGGGCCSDSAASGCLRSASLAGELLTRRIVRPLVRHRGDRAPHSAPATSPPARPPRSPRGRRGRRGAEPARRPHRRTDRRGARDRRRPVAPVAHPADGAAAGRRGAARPGRGRADRQPRHRRWNACSRR